MRRICVDLKYSQGFESSRDTYSSWDLGTEIGEHISEIKCFILPKITTLLALVKFSPVPPASVEIRNTKTPGSLLNLSIIGMPYVMPEYKSELLQRNTHDRVV